MGFTQLGLSPATLEGVKAMGYVEPTPIQLRAIPLILAGQDVIGSAQTGTGKTAAFALPILTLLGQQSRAPRVLVLEPTRELAAQVETAVRELLHRVNYDSVIVFCRTKNRADRIGNLLRKNNHAVAILHSNRTQREREQALRGFRDGRYEVLVATDIAARGLDIANVSHVINFDVPQHPEDYVHRIGRTGRAEASGDAFTLMVAEDVMHVRSIERFISQKIERIKLEGFNYKYTVILDEKRDQQPADERRTRGVRLRGGYYFGPARRRR